MRARIKNSRKSTRRTKRKRTPRSVTKEQIYVEADIITLHLGMRGR